MGFRRRCGGWRAGTLLGRVAVVVPLVLTLVVSALGPVAAGETDDGTPPRLAPSTGAAVAATFARGSGVAAFDATPAATPGVASNAGPGSLASLLARMPDVLSLPGAPGFDVATYADIAGQLAAVGVAAPTDPDDPATQEWIRATVGLTIPSPLREHALNPVWTDTFGFGVTDLDQALTIGEPPSLTTLMRGRFDVAAVRAAWRTNGYQAREIGGVVVASLAEDAGRDPSTDLGRLTLGRFDQMAFLDDETLVATRTADEMAAVLAVADGSRPSLAERAEIAALLRAAPPDLASAVVVNGAALLGGDPAAVIGAGSDPEQVDAIATRLAADIADAAAMPPVRFALIGVTAGGPLALPLDPDAPEPTPPPAAAPEARIAIRVLFADRAAAERAAPIVERRLAEGASARTQQPYAEFFPDPRLGVAVSDPVLELDMRSAERPQSVIWQMLYARDLGFLAW